MCSLTIIMNIRLFSFIYVQLLYCILAFEDNVWKMTITLKLYFLKYLCIFECFVL